MTAAQPGEYLFDLGDYANAIVAQNANIVYVGGVDQASGTSFVYRTANGGTTWTDISSVGGIGPNTYVHSMSLDSAGNLIVGTDGGVWRYNIAGAGSWTDLNGNLDDVELNGIATNPANASDVLATSPTTGAFLYNGTSQAWTQTLGGATGAVSFAGGFSGYFGDIAFDPANAQIVYQSVDTAGGGVLDKSTTGGIAGSWVPTAFFPGILGTFPFVVDSVNTSRIVAGADTAGGALGAVQESLNQGATWVNLRVPAADLSDATSVAISTYQGTFVADPSFPAVTDLGSNNYDADTIYASDGKNSSSPRTAGPPGSSAAPSCRAARISPTSKSIRATATRCTRSPAVSPPAPRWAASSRAPMPAKLGPTSAPDCRMCPPGSSPSIRAATIFTLGATTASGF